MTYSVETIRNRASNSAQMRNGLVQTNAATRNSRSGVVIDASFLAVVTCTAFLYWALVAFYIGPLRSYAYQSMYTLNVDWVLLWLGFFSSIAIAAILPKNASPVNVFLWLLYLMIIVPRFITCGCHTGDVLYLALCVLTFLIAAALSQSLSRWSFKIGDAAVNTRICFIVLAGITIVAIVLIVYLLNSKGLPSLRALNFDEVYEIRAENNFSGSISAILSTWGGRLLPMLICFFLCSGRRGHAVGVTVIEFLLYLWSANKAWLLEVLLIWGLFAFLSKKRFSIKNIVVPFSVIIVAILIWWQLTNSGTSYTAFSMLVRRLMFMPASLGYAYYEFFGDNPIVWLQNTILSPMTPMPTEYSQISYKIQAGWLAVGSNAGTMWANTGMFGDEFANFGTIGGWLAILINLVLMAKLLSYDCSEKAKGFVSLAAVLFAFNLLNGSTIRMLFSPTGMFATALLLVLIITFDEYSSTAKNSNTAPKGGGLASKQ